MVVDFSICVCVWGSILGVEFSGSFSVEGWFKLYLLYVGVHVFIPFHFIEIQTLGREEHGNTNKIIICHLYENDKLHWIFGFHTAIFLLSVICLRDAHFAKNKVYFFTKQNLSDTLYSQFCIFFPCMGIFPVIVNIYIYHQFFSQMKLRKRGISSRVHFLSIPFTAKIRYYDATEDLVVGNFF